MLTRGPPLHPQLAGLVFEAVPGDIGDRRSLEHLVEAADIVVHCAGLTKSRARGDLHRANVQGAELLGAAIAAKAPTSRVVAVSSLAAREPAVSEYAASKAAGEAALRRALPPHAELVVLRPAAVYGPWDRDTLSLVRIVARGIAPLLNHAAARVALAHVGDVADAIAAACEAPLAGGTYEIADERDGYAWAEIIDALALALGGSARRLRVPRAALVGVAALAGLGCRALAKPQILSLGKARELLHADWSCAPERRLPEYVWQPRVSLCEGLADAVAWYRSAGWLAPAPCT